MYGFSEKPASPAEENELSENPVHGGQEILVITAAGLSENPAAVRIDHPEVNRARSLMHSCILNFKIHEKIRRRSRILPPLHGFSLDLEDRSVACRCRGRGEFYNSF